VAPYVPGEQPKASKKIIKLNTNENPYPPSPKIKKVVQGILSKGLLRKYSNPISSPVVKELAKLHKVPESSIMVTNGSDEGLSILFRATLGSGDIALMPYPTYSLYPVLTNLQLNGAKINQIELRPDFHFDFEKLKKSINPKTKLIAFANPNAPTGILESKQDLIDLIRSFNGIVLCDEAYIDFAPNNSSMISEINNLDNLIISRTLSKSYGLAGLRVGYLISKPENISELMKLKDSYNLGMLEQEIATAAIQDQKYFKTTIKKIIASRKKLSSDLKKLKFEILESNTNFLFIKPPKTHKAEDLFNYLKTKEVFVRYFKDDYCKDFLRITVGTDSENKNLISHLKIALKEKS